MPYYHVLLSFQDEPKTVRCLFADLAEKELRKQFVTPYRRGKNVLCGSEVIEVSRIKTVKIIRTADTSDQALERIEEKGIKHYEELNRGSRGVVFFRLDSRLEHIGEGGEEVTHAFILGPPGHGDRWAVVAAVLNNPWTSGIGAGLILAGLVWWFGL